MGNFSMPLAMEEEASAIIDGDLKLITGTVPFYFDQSPIWPVSNYSWVWDKSLHCGQSGCLFNITSDPSELKDLASELPDDLAKMQQLLGNEMKNMYVAP